MINQMAASSDFFYSTCSNVLEKMINTIPKNVVLTEPLTPIPVKPIDRTFDINLLSDGTMTVSGEIRVSLCIFCLHNCVSLNAETWSGSRKRPAKHYYECDYSFQASKPRFMQRDYRNVRSIAVQSSCPGFRLLCSSSGKPQLYDLLI